VHNGTAAPADVSGVLEDRDRIVEIREVAGDLEPVAEARARFAA
jgi:hypothetical protein